MKVLVTGGSGFVGRHVVPRLQSEGFDVVALSRHGTGARRGVDVVRGDVGDLSSLIAALEGVDAVLHLVAIITERGEQTFERVNVSGTNNVLEAMRARGVERLVHLSAFGTSAD